MRRRPIHIVMSSRAVVAAGEPFVPRADEYADANVARDEISDLRAQSEPLVLRVVAVGSNAKERAEVVGDWLCLADGSAPKRIPDVSQDHGAASRRRPDKSELVHAWEKSAEATWLLHCAATYGVDPRVVVGGCCACARMATRAADLRASDLNGALNAAERWARGGRGEDLQEEWVMSLDRAERYNASTDAARSYAAMAIRSAVFAAHTAESSLDWSKVEQSWPVRRAASEPAEHLAREARMTASRAIASGAAEVATISGLAIACAVAPGEARAGYSLSDAVRSAIPTLAVLRAAVGE